MRRLACLLLCISGLLGQWEPDSLAAELEDPDEEALESVLLDRLFRLNSQDPGSRPTGRMRQRFSFHPTSGGWRIMNKGLIRAASFDLMAVLEQDPTESALTDHAVFTVTLRQIPGISQLILGDFHTAWGGGFLTGQTGTRWSLAPGSLVQQARLEVRPHYSTREQDFYHGLGFTRTGGQVTLAGFLSSRQMLGQLGAEGFKEDGDGIHPAGLTFVTRQERTAGLAIRYGHDRIQLFLGFITQNSPSPGFVSGEWSLGLNPVADHFLQLAGDGQGNSRFIWLYTSSRLTASVQYRWFTQKERLSTSTLSFLPATCSAETGFSTRVQFRPTRTWYLRYGYDQASVPEIRQLQQLGTTVRYALQLGLKRRRSNWQLDHSKRGNDFTVPLNIWTGPASPQSISKWGISWTRELSTTFQFRANLKLAANSGAPAWLVQQRLMWEKDPWRIHAGILRHAVGEYDLRLSVYESSPVESFGFFTAYDDGQRWFGYLSYTLNPCVLELKLAGSQSFTKADGVQQLSGSCQLSIVF